VADSSEPVLSTRALNRALLSRQLLLERVRVPLPRALERMAGLQAQYAPAMYVGLWSRVDGFQRADLTRGLERRTVVQGTLLRATIHLVSRADYWPFTVAVRDARRAWFLRAQGEGLTEADAAVAADELRVLLADGPMKRDQIDKALGKARAAAASTVVDLVRVPPSGTWERRRADLYHLAETWIGPPEIEPDAALEHIVRRYLAAFGPATIGEIGDWAGLPKRMIAVVIDRLDVRHFLDETGQGLIDLPRGSRPDPETVAPVRFLSTWDASLLVHARRKAILPEAYRPLIFNTKMPQSVPTFLVDGAVAGTWRYENGAVRVEPFASLGRGARREVDDEAARLAAFHAD
jgi:hypothetical protein